MSDTDDLRDYLRPATFIDSAHPAIVARLETVLEPGADNVANAVALYYHVRDGLRYNPYSLGTSAQDYLASTTLESGEGWCVPKALVLAALCRAARRGCGGRGRGAHRPGAGGWTGAGVAQPKTPPGGRRTQGVEGSQTRPPPTGMSRGP